MPYDPNLPAEGTPLASAEMRGQLQGLHDLIQTGGGVSGAQVDSVTTVDPGQPAAASAGLVGQTLHFHFAIPRGFDGSSGANGNDGLPGAPGEVSQSTLNGAIATTSANSNGVSLLNLFISDPPTQGELQAVANKLDELIQALRRT
jgi:hypothetical protein